MDFISFIREALAEDIQDGDHSTRCCIPANKMGKAVLKVKEDGIIAGIEEAQAIVHLIEPSAQFSVFIQDGMQVKNGDIAFELIASVHTILQTERLVLNIMQRMSGIASLTRTYVNKIAGYSSQILDTRKTTPNFRAFEKKAVTLGGGHNHRMGLYDMIMLKDNHIDYCGSIEKAIAMANAYLQQHQLTIPIEIETRSLQDVERVVAIGGVQRIMLDNFTPEQITNALQIINKKFETEASGGITLDTIEKFAQTGVDYISVGAIIHHAVSMDLSLKAVIVS